MVPSQNPDGQVLVIDHWYKTKGTPFTARLSRPVPQVRRPRRQPRLVHVHAERNAHERRDGAEQVQADHHARHASAGRRRRAHLRAAVHRAVRSEHASAVAQGQSDGRPGDGGSAVVGRQGGRRVGRRATTCGRRRASTWSTTASRASSPRSPTAISPIPVKSTNGQPLGWHDSRAHFPVPYPKDTWTLRAAGRLRRHRRVCRHGRSREVRHELADEFLSRPSRLVERGIDGVGPFAYVVPAEQRDNYGLLEMLDILQFGAVEIHQATARVQRERQAVRRRLVRDQDRAAVRRVREHDAGSARTIRTCASSRAVRRSRRTTSPGTRCGC